MDAGVLVEQRAGEGNGELGMGEGQQRPLLDRKGTQRGKSTPKAKVILGGTTPNQDASSQHEGDLSDQIQIIYIIKGPSIYSLCPLYPVHARSNSHLPHSLFRIPI